MKGIKFLMISAASGFILSFLFGLFSHTSIISILLKAILFAVVFGILGFLINLAVYKFLIDESQDSKELSGMNSDGNVIYSGNESKTGQVVDITIQDEELEKGESDNHFVVGDAHTMLKDSDVEKSGFSDYSAFYKAYKKRTGKLNWSREKCFEKTNGYAEYTCNSARTNRCTYQYFY